MVCPYPYSKTSRWSRCAGILARHLCQDERLTKIYGDQGCNGVFAKEIKKLAPNLRKLLNQNRPRDLSQLLKDGLLKEPSLGRFFQTNRQRL